jgi:DNA-binding response OmpR family regulator
MRDTGKPPRRGLDVLKRWRSRSDQLGVIAMTGIGLAVCRW